MTWKHNVRIVAPDLDLELELELDHREISLLDDQSFGPSLRDLRVELYVSQ